MKFLLSILYFSILIKLYLNQSNNATPLETFVDKYAKYIVNIYGQWGEIQQFWVGVILKEDIILTAYIDDGTSDETKRVLESQVRNLNVGTFINYGRVTANTVNYTIDDKKINLKRAINFNNNIIKLPQLSVVQLENQFELNNEISIVPLARDRHNKDDVCVTLGWGYNGTEDSLQVHKVIIQDDCGDGIICFERYFEDEAVDHCSTYAGGEPIFCADTLVGLVSYEFDCDDTKPAKAASVFDCMKWIQLKMDELDADE